MTGHGESTGNWDWDYIVFSWDQVVFMMSVYRLPVEYWRLHTLRARLGRTQQNMGHIGPRLL